MRDKDTRHQREELSEFGWGGPHGLQFLHGQREAEGRLWLNGTETCLTSVLYPSQGLLPIMQANAVLSKSGPTRVQTTITVQPLASR